MTSFKVVFLVEYYQVYQTIGDVMGGECSTYWEGREVKCIPSVAWKTCRNETVWKT
jgi:hypothetical protein